MKFKILISLSAFVFTQSCGTSDKINTNDSTMETVIENGEIKLRESYAILDKKYGTKTRFIVNKDQMTMKTNSLPNHNTGEFPNKGNPNTISSQEKEYNFPLKPTFSGESKWARETGIAVNGVKFEPETAERFVCETGEVYRIEAIQDLFNLGLDHNHAHVQPTGAYHYHGAPTELIKKLDKGEDLILIGYANDGFPMYYSKSGQYKPSFVLSSDLRTGDVCEYKNPHNAIKDNFQDSEPNGTFVSDWVYEEGLGHLDECNGIDLNGEYVYFVTDEYPYIGRCLKGKFTEKHPSGPPPGAHSHKKR